MHILADSAVRKKVSARGKLEGPLCPRSAHPFVLKAFAKERRMEEKNGGSHSELTKTSLLDWIGSVTVL